jgi:hypothetical protein
MARLSVSQRSHFQLKVGYCTKTVSLTYGGLSSSHQCQPKLKVILRTQLTASSGVLRDGSGRNQTSGKRLFGTFMLFPQGLRKIITHFRSCRGFRKHNVAVRNVRETRQGQPLASRMSGCTILSDVNQLASYKEASN